MKTLLKVFLVISFLSGLVQAQVPNNPYDTWYEGVSTHYNSNAVDENGIPYDIRNENYPRGINWDLEVSKAFSANTDYLGSFSSLPKICILDTGFYSNHEALNISEISIPNFQISNLDMVHGTNTAGVLTKTIESVSGITPNVNVMTVESSFWAIYSIDNALEQMVRSGCKVINMSIDYPYSFGNETAWNDSIETLENEGYDFLIVHSAGNDFSNAYYNLPITDTNKHRFITTGSMDIEYGVDNSYQYQLWNDTGGVGSNYGSYVDILAPGGFSGIYTTQSIDADTGTHLYDRSFGQTSAAAPFVSGGAALVWALRPELTAEDVKSIIVSSGTDNVIHEGISYPVLNIKNALDTASAYVKPKVEISSPSYLNEPGSVEYIQNGSAFTVYLKFSGQTDENFNYTITSSAGQTSVTNGTFSGNHLSQVTYLAPTDPQYLYSIQTVTIKMFEGTKLLDTATVGFFLY